MNTIKNNLICLLALHCVMPLAQAVTHVYIDENSNYRAWTAPGTHGRCTATAGFKFDEWQFQNVTGTKLINELFPDPCAYQITCPDISTYDENKVICSLEADWNRSLATCALANAIQAKGTPNDPPTLIQSATLDADKEYKCFVNGDVTNGKLFYPRKQMEGKTVCGSRIYAVTDKDATQAIMTDQKDGDTIIKSNILCHTYSTGDHKPTCGRTQTTTIITCKN